MKIGILTCTNTTQNLDCSSSGCLRAFNDGTGAFAAHGDEEIEIAGVINCAGCPTVMAPKKILRRIGVLNEVGVERLHMSSCVMNLCPFKKKYKAVIEEAYPNMQVIEGTEAPEGIPLEQAMEMFKMGIGGMLQETPRNMVEMYQAIDQARQSPAP